MNYETNIFDQPYVMLHLFSVLSRKYSPIIFNDGFKQLIDTKDHRHKLMEDYFEDTKGQMEWWNFEQFVHLTPRNICQILHNKKIMDNMKLIISLQPKIRSSVMYQDMIKKVKNNKQKYDYIFSILTENCDYAKFNDKYTYMKNDGSCIYTPDRKYDVKMFTQRC
ncbi:hypothetical protein FACS189472_15030 [Alphaproteobacteria bacterium]|nr:hypothetical protein FACS189472_15030 [Alphaproteobacteria bacterium]